MLYYSLRILTAWFVYILPAYSSFKSLSHRPVSDADLERWVKHWTVIAFVVAWEIVFEYFVSWLPFFYEAKTIFLLFLSLPQTQGAVYLYDVHIQPVLARNEISIDAHIESARANIITFASGRLTAVFQGIYGGFLNAQTQANAKAEQQGKPAPQPVIGIPTQLASNIYSGLGSMLAGAIAKANSAPSASSAAASVAPQQVPLPPTPAAQ